MRRRAFLASGSALAVRPPVPAASGDPSARVTFAGDGLGLTPLEYSRLLTRVVEERNIQPDSYALGGVIEQLEERFASILGKEQAVFLPTGTLANHLAVRLLAGGRRRVLVQQESHLYNDCGDCAQTLSGLNLAPLAAGRATFTADETAAQLRTDGRVPTPAGAIQIESPVRRKQGELFEPGEMRKVCALARTKGIGLHLDGARIFLASAYTGVSPAGYAALFDTVYVSLYKYFNAASGAILAGPKRLLDGLFNTRRQFGGGLAHAWPMAAVALHYVDGFEQRYLAARKASEELYSQLEKTGRFRIGRIQPGSNLAWLRVAQGDAAAFRTRLSANGISVPAPDSSGGILVAVNETLLRRPVDVLTRAFISALG
ncbi:MAG TPA: beta-eliminating lyase-related protein [Bryobacteraceae bacterium]|nr:beta-eliminating lyase-related protein [Bryobacteraceae bacterium]